MEKADFGIVFDTENEMFFEYMGCKSEKKAE